VKGYIKKYWRVLFILTAFIAFALNILRLHYTRAYNSDGVELQNIVYFWQHSQHQLAYLGDDNFFFKIPFYLVYDHLGLSPRNTQLLTFASFMFISFAALYYALVKLGKLFNWFREEYVAVGLVYLISLNRVYEYAMISNVRNIELGLIFLLILPAALGFKKQLNVGWWILTGILLSLLIFSDPYFAYSIVLPLLALLAFNLWLDKKHRATRAIPVVWLALSAVLWKIWHALLPRLKVRLVAIPAKFTALATLASNIKFWSIALIALGGIDYSAGIFHSVPWVFFVNLPLIVALMTYSLYLTITSLKNFKNDPWKTFMAATPLIISGIYILQPSDMTQEFRYLILAAFGFPALIAFALNQFRFKWLIATVVIAVAVANTVRAGITVASGDLRPNLINYQLVATVRNLGLDKGYTDYWNAGINTYFSKKQIRFLQIACNSEHELQPMYWLVDQGEYQAHANRTFYLFDNQAFYTKNCSPEQSMSQLGQPSQIVRIGSQYELAVYNYDIFTKLVNTQPNVR